MNGYKYYNPFHSEKSKNLLFLDFFRQDGSFYEFVWDHRVDAYQRSGHLYHLPRVLEPPFRVVVAGQINRPSRFGTFQHAPGVGTVGRDHMTIPEFYIGHEAFISFDQGSANEIGPF